MSHPTPTYQLIEDRLDGTFADFIAGRRPHTSWRDIAAEIQTMTGVAVTHETLRTWFADRITFEVRVS